jgi:hypothetical protein
MKPSSIRIVLGCAVLTALSIAVGYWGTPAQTNNKNNPASISATKDEAGVITLHFTEAQQEAFAYRNDKRGKTPPWEIPPLTDTEAAAWAQLTAEERRADAQTSGDSQRWVHVFSINNPALTESFLLARRQEFIDELRMESLPLTYRYELAEMLLLVDINSKHYKFPGSFLPLNDWLKATGMYYNTYRDRHVTLAIGTLEKAIERFPTDATAEYINEQLTAAGWNLYAEDLAYALSKMRSSTVKPNK